MAKEIKLALVYRDMWQSSGKYVPRVDQLNEVAEPIIEIGCFDRVETNGGGFEQINLLFGENPNRSVREWTQAFNDAGIQTQMLERGLNGIRMSPVPKDVRKLMFAVKKKQGTDISRSFDGLNNTQNLEHSFQYAKEAGMIAQGALSLTYSPIHTVEHYIDLAKQYVTAGAQEICIKDMAGIGRPVSIGKITKGIRANHPDITIQYHGHSTPGFSLASSLEAARNGADIIDTGMQPLSWGTGHADLLAVHAMLKDAGFLLKDINMDAYMHVRSLTQKFMDDFLGYYINPQNRFMNSLLIGPGLPGGMMGSLMADLQKNLSSLNKWMKKNGKEEITQDQLLIKLFKEVEYIWPKLGYPPLVTPFSQYVKNLALINVMQVAKGKDRWSLIDENTWGMMLGKSGKLPGPLDDELIAMAKSQGREFSTARPSDLYPDELDMYRDKMKEKAWDFGQDDEELMEYAMHPQQYEDYKSGKAKKSFEEDLAKKKMAKLSENNISWPQTLDVEIEGQKYAVTLGENTGPASNAAIASSAAPESDLKGDYVIAPLEGTFYMTKDPGEKAKKIGDKINKGETIAYIESMKVINAISSDYTGTITEILATNGEEVEEDVELFKIS